MKIAELALSSITQFASCIFLIYAGLLWIQRGNIRQRVFLALAFAVCGVDFFLRILNHYNEVLFLGTVLNSGSLYLFLIKMPLFLCYIIETINPSWLSARKVIAMLVPILVWNLFLLLPKYDFRELYSFSEMISHISEVNVWIRLVIVSLIIPYLIVGFRVCRACRQDNASFAPVRFCNMGFVFMAIFFAVMSFIGSPVALSLYIIYGVFYCSYVAYVELFVRHDNIDDMIGINNIVKTQQIEVLPNDISIDKIEESTIKVNHDSVEQWKKMLHKIESGRLWRNPDLTLTELARLLNTNRTTLLRLLQENGYSKGYKEFLNRYRITDFISIMEQNPKMNIQDAFFDAGYGSRMTALRNFKEYTGKTPSEYFNKH